jgi:YebC/PmpR family DNA-binding regulatory protein
MSHSQWEVIRLKKAKVDSAKNSIYTRHARAIMVAARHGADPDANFSLRTAIDKAKIAGLPNDNIERAIKKGAGHLAGQDELESIRYEGYGPNGVAVLMEILTDNRNRTAAEVREAFNKTGGNLGETGCVSWMFDQKGVIQIIGADDEEALLLAVAEAGGDDFSYSGENVQVFCDYTQLETVSNHLRNKGYHVKDISIHWIPNSMVSLDEPEAAKQVLKLMDRLDALDDVQNVFANFQIEDTVLSAL